MVLCTCMLFCFVFLFLFYFLSWGWCLEYLWSGDCVWFAQVTEEVESTENEKEKEGNEEVHPDKDDADEENDVADRRPTLQRNYNADDSNSLPSTDSQRRGRSDSNTRTPSAGGHRSGGPGGPGGPRRLPRERGFLVRVSNPVGQHVRVHTLTNWLITCNISCNVLFKLVHLLGWFIYSIIIHKKSSA